MNLSQIFQKVFTYLFLYLDTYGKYILYIVNKQVKIGSFSWKNIFLSVVLQMAIIRFRVYNLYILFLYRN